MCIMGSLFGALLVMVYRTVRSDQAGEVMRTARAGGYLGIQGAGDRRDVCRTALASAALADASRPAPGPRRAQSSKMVNLNASSLDY